jgi:hypothetical protein
MRRPSIKSGDSCLASTHRPTTSSCADQSSACQLIPNTAGTRLADPIASFIGVGCRMRSTAQTLQVCASCLSLMTRETGFTSGSRLQGATRFARSQSAFRKLTRFHTHTFDRIDDPTSYPTTVGGTRNIKIGLIAAKHSQSRMKLPQRIARTDRLRRIRLTRSEGTRTRF